VKFTAVLGWKTIQGSTWLSEVLLELRLGTFMDAKTN